MLVKCLSTSPPVMDSQALPAPCPLEQLPAELQQMILSVLPDIQSLQAAILCCSTIHAAFTSAEASVTSMVLLNELDSDVMPEAFVAESTLHPFETVRPRNPDVYNDNYYQFAEKHLQQRCQSSGSRRLPDALRIVKLHDCIRIWAARFADATLKTMREETMYERLEPDPYDSVQIDATDNEMKRIERAFYRLEIFCNLFRGGLLRLRWAIDRHLADVRRVFCLNFAPWENEQMACVMDFLVRWMSQGRNIFIHPLCFFLTIIDFVGSQQNLRWAHEIPRLKHVEMQKSFLVGYLNNIGLQKLTEVKRAHKPLLKLQKTLVAIQTDSDDLDKEKAFRAYVLTILSPAAMHIH